MASSQIGIKIADGTFYPVLDEGTNEKKRLVLTTVKDKQENVQIDLYRSSDGSLEEADYVGSLVIENITPAPQRGAGSRGYTRYRRGRHSECSSKRQGYGQ